MIDNKREYGDWQTPLDFAKKCCEVLADHLSYRPDYIIEPTCGIGNFIEAAKETFSGVPILGMEINENYIETMHSRFGNERDIEIIQGDYLKEDIIKTISNKNATLVLGNPPWVTTSFLSLLESANLPKKENYKKLRGIDAMTGQSNFDISEWIIHKAVSTFNKCGDMLAMLCKTNVARNICTELAKKHSNVKCMILSFDSRSVFGVNVSACLFVCDFRHHGFSALEGDLDVSKKMNELEFWDGKIRKKIPKKFHALKGTSALEWRQGVKHDCGKIMELRITDGNITNKLGERVNIEKDYVFPFVKSSNSRKYIIDETEMAIPMTQRKIGEETAHLQDDAPLFWGYLQRHSEFFKARKSKIYKNAPDYALFGVGDYSYAPYKVSVSGFYKQPIFSLAKGKKPIMFDDTCYFIPFKRESDAKTCMLLLNSPLVQEYYSCIAFLDNKRPFSKKVLSSINLANALDLVGLEGLNQTAKCLKVNLNVSKEEYQSFFSLVNCEQMANSLS